VRQEGCGLLDRRRSFSDRNQFEVIATFSPGRSTPQSGQPEYRYISNRAKVALPRWERKSCILGFEPRKLTGRPWYSPPRPLLCDRCLQYSRYGMYVLSNPVGPVRGRPDPRVTAGDGQTSCSPRIPLRSLCDSRTTV
jgi:hypothetical protein